MKRSDVEILHSSADAYIAEVDRSSLPVKREPLTSGSCMVGCYTSMVRIKQAHRSLENKIAMTEKIMSYADMTLDLEFDGAELKKAKKALAFCQFHDVLPGSGIRAVEEDSLRTLNYGEEIADKLYMKAFFKLCEGQKQAKDGEIPILVFNPHPYEIEGEFEVDFILESQNWNDGEETFAVVYDQNGNDLPTQNEQANSSINLDWAKKISFKGTIAPSSVTRFDCKLITVKSDTLPQKEYVGETICVKNDRMKVCISKKTGLIHRYEVDGRVLTADSGRIEVYKDNEDSWGSSVDSFKEYEGCFTLMDDEKVNEFVGYPEEKYSNVRVVEDGDVRIKIQAFFEYKRSVAVVEYTIPKAGTYVDVNILMYSMETNKMIKYRIDTALNGIPYGETAFGEEKLYADEREAVFHKWCGIREEDTQLYVVNKGIYGGSFTDRTIKLSLLRTPVYSALPANDRQLSPHDRLLRHIDMGEREFSFRITTEKNIEREAQIYNESPALLSFFPSGAGTKPGEVIRIDNPDVILSSMKKWEKRYILNLHNFSGKENDAEIMLIPTHKKINLHFGSYEFKTIEVEL